MLEFAILTERSQPNLMDNNIQEIFQVAHTHHQNNQLQEAENGYLEILQLQTDHLESQLNLSNIYLVSNRPTEALNLLIPLSENHPEMALVWSNLGVAQKFLMNYDQSLIAYEKAAALNPEAPEIKHDMSMVLQLLNRNDEAIQVLQSLAATYPRYLPARFFHVQLLNALF